MLLATASKLAKQAAAFSLVLPHAAHAHLLGATQDRASLNVWQVDPVALTLLIVTALLYFRGCKTLRKRNLNDRKKFNRRQRYFWLGWGALVVALASPIDPLGELLFSVHMVQHELIMIVAGPLLVLSRPTSALLHGLGRSASQSLVLSIRSVGLLRRDFFLNPGTAWTIHAIGLWGWHIPMLFNAGLENAWVHTAQHISFLLIALIFWYSLMHIQKARSVVGLLYLFTTALHASLLGALLTFSPKVWYPPYLETASQFGLSALEDQQLGGLIMWMPSGIVFIVAALLVLARVLPGAPVTHPKPERYHE